MLEKVGDARQLRRQNVGIIIHIIIIGRQLVVRGGEDFLVQPALVLHQQNTDRPRAHDASRDQGGRAEQQHVNRIAIIRQRVRDEAVIARIAHRRVQEAIDEDRAGGLVHLVLDRVAANRHFHDHVDVFGRIHPDGDGVNIHGGQSCMWEEARHSAGAASGQACKLTQQDAVAELRRIAIGIIHRQPEADRRIAVIFGTPLITTAAMTIVESGYRIFRKITVRLIKSGVCMWPWRLSPGGTGCKKQGVYMQLGLRFVLGAAFLVLLGFAGCAVTQNPISTITMDDDSHTLPEFPTDVSPVPIRFSTVVTGTSSAPEGAVFEGGSWFRTRTLAHSAFLVCHPGGLIVFDTGLGADIDAQYADMPAFGRFLISYERRPTLHNQLDREGFCPGREMRIVLSHLHWDHASAIEEWPGVDVWVRSEERDVALASGNSLGYLASQFDDPDISWRRLEFPDSSFLTYETSSDVFGDGTVVLVPMTGHTSGSVGMFVTLPSGQRLFMTGDTTWALEGFNRPAHKFALIRRVVDRDIDLLEDEIRNVNLLMRIDPSMIVVPAHDLDAYPPESAYPCFMPSGCVEDVARQP